MTSIFSPPKPAIVTPPSPAPTPEADDEQIAAAKKRALAEQMQRSGRQSTILTDTSDKFGG